MKPFFIFLIAGITFFNCNVSNKSFKNGDKWIPDNFDPKTTTLLIEIVPLRGYNEKMISFLGKKYPYRYVVVSKQDINNKKGKYSDTKAYPFALLWTTNSRMSTAYNGMNIDLDGYFLDRVKNYSYSPSKKTLNYGGKGFAPIINTIVNKYK